MKYHCEMSCISNGYNGITTLPDRYITTFGKILRMVKVTIEVPVLFYSHNPAGGEISARNIGAFTYFNYNPEIRNVERIGRFCSFGQNVIVGVGGHSTTALTHHQMFEQKQYWAEPYWDYSEEWVYTNAKKNLESEPKRSISAVIGNDVWIGANSIILNGINVGDGAIIATGSVVTKDVPPYAIVGGNPAKIIRMRFEDDLIERLLKVKWWIYGPDVLKNINIATPYECIDELEQRINEGFPQYIPDKFEFDVKKKTITKIYAETEKRELIYKL